MKNKTKHILREYIQRILREEDDSDWEVYEKMNEMKYNVLSSFKEALNKHKASGREYMEERQNWNTIPFGTLQRIWQQFIKFGEVPSQLWKYLDKIEAIITNNILKIDVNTEFAGHKTQVDTDVLEDYEISEEDLREHFGDFIMDPNGQWRLSDYGLEPLLQKLSELRKLKTPKDRLVKIDQILEIVHARSDIAGWFIAGGSRALSDLSKYERTTEETKNLSNILNDLKKTLESFKKYMHDETYWYFRRKIVANEKQIIDQPEDHNVLLADIETISNELNTKIDQVKNSSSYKEQEKMVAEVRQLVRKTLLKEVSDNYITHFNGGRTFSVHNSDNFLYVFKNAFQIHDNVLKIFNEDKEDDNSSILVKLSAKGKDKKEDLYYKELKHKYLFIGEEVYSFETDDEITKFYTPIGNSDVAYPVALSKENAYFMLDKQYVDRSEFPKDINWKDAYQYFYGHEDFENKDKLKKKKFKNSKMVEKNPLRENKVRSLIRETISEILTEKVIHKRLGQFGLDSGQAIIVDPAHLDSCELPTHAKGDGMGFRSQYSS